MAISFVRKLKNGQVMDAVWEELTWWVVFAGIGLMAAGMTSVVLYVGLAMVVLGTGADQQGLRQNYRDLRFSVQSHHRVFRDILSYSRLMALMLAGSVIAQVFNTLGAIPGNIIVFLIISLAGNALNFALNLLGCYVHDLRLQCLEYFGKFYEDGGKPSSPDADTNTLTLQNKSLFRRNPIMTELAQMFELQQRCYFLRQLGRSGSGPAGRWPGGCSLRHRLRKGHRHGR